MEKEETSFHFLDKCPDIMPIRYSFFWTYYAPWRYTSR